VGLSTLALRTLLLFGRWVSLMKKKV